MLVVLSVPIVMEFPEPLIAVVVVRLAPVPVPVALAVVAVFWGVAGAVVVAESIVVVVVAGINIGFKSLLYELWVVVLEGAIFAQECTIVGNGFLCLLSFLFVEEGFC